MEHIGIIWAMNKLWLFSVYRGFYYPVMIIINRHKDPYWRTSIMKVRGFFRMAINPIVRVYIPIAKDPMDRGMTIPTFVHGAIFQGWTCPAQDWGEAIDDGSRGPLLPHQQAANGGSSGGWRWLHVWPFDGGGALQTQWLQSHDETAIQEPRALPFELTLIDESWVRLGWCASQKIRLIAWSRTCWRDQPWKWCCWSTMFNWTARTWIALQKQSEGYTWIFCIRL